jgi:hypothetical protein
VDIHLAGGVVARSLEAVNRARGDNDDGAGLDLERLAVDRKARRSLCTTSVSS